MIWPVGSTGNNLKLKLIINIFVIRYKQFISIFLVCKI